MEEKMTKVDLIPKYVGIMSLLIVLTLPTVTQSLEMVEKESKWLASVMLVSSSLFGMGAIGGIIWDVLKRFYKIED